MVLVIDNYDSFTYNLVQAVAALGYRVEVRRNDRIDLQGIERIAPKCIVISPGPCTPREAGISVAVVQAFADVVPILGVCLGHQSIAAAFGGEIVRAERLMHGKTSPVRHDGKAIYRGVPQPFTAARYHSLVVREESLSDAFVVTARSDRGELMGIRHRRLPLEGVQFHPESFLTPEGSIMIRNFLEASHA